MTTWAFGSSPPYANANRITHSAARHDCAIEAMCGLWYFGCTAAAAGKDWSDDDQRAFEAPVREQYELQGHPYYATARLWDDGVIDPADTRRVLALGLSATLNAPIPEPKFGIFRM